MRDWLHRRGRIYWYDQYALNEQETAFAKYDPGRIVEELMGTGADIIVVYAANQFSIAYYPSAIWPQHPNLKGRDYFGDLVTRLRARGKKVIGYINWLESRHPEWNTVPLGSDPAQCRAELPLATWADPADPAKRVQNVPGGNWRQPCINSPRREDVKAVAREIVERYPLDGFHLDMFHANGALCVCDYCRPTLERICGTKDISREAVAAHWREFIDWKCERSASLIADMTAILHEHGVLAAHNAATPLHLPAIYGVGEDWMPHLDVYVSEIFSNLHVPSVTVRLQRALGLPSWELLTSAFPGFAHLTVPAAWWRLSAAACKANGGEVLGPCGVGAYPDTTTSKRLLDTVKQGLDFFMEDADLAEGAASGAKIALVFSWATRKYHRAGVMDWSSEIDGWSNLLMEEHLPFDFVVAEKVTSPSAFSQYDLVILPNTANTSETFCAALSEYVRGGGRVLATGESSLFNERGIRLDDFALAPILGVAGKQVTEGCFAFERPDGPAPATGVYHDVETNGEILSYRVSLDPAGSVAGAKDPLPLARTDWPVAVRNVCGNGKSVYVAFDIGKCYAMQRLEHIGAFMAELIAAALPVRQIEVKGPRSIEVTVAHQEAKKRLIIHIANRPQGSTDLTQITEVVPVCGIEVRLQKPVPEPKVSCRGGQIETSIEGEYVRIRLAKLDAYAAILIE